MTYKISEAECYPGVQFRKNTLFIKNMLYKFQIKPLTTMKMILKVMALKLYASF